MRILHLAGTLLVVCIAACVTAEPDGAERPFVVAVRGRPTECVVALPARPTPSQEYAAAEFRDHVRAMTGVELAVERGVPTDDMRRRVAIRGWNGRGDDGFRIAVEKDVLAIEGGVRGVIYGVYEVLEHFGGCRWYASWHAVAPKLDEFSVPASFRDEQSPAFFMRYPFWHDVRANPRFAVRLRANGPYSSRPLAETPGGVPYRWGAGLRSCHTFARLCPVQRHGKDHPEYFALHRGARDVGTSDPQLCLTNPDVLRVVTSNVLACIRNDPEAGYYGVSQNDNQRFCTCDACRRVDEEEGSRAGTMIRFVNAVAEAVEKEFPKAIIETLAYQYTRKPPTKTRPRGNVLICLCSIECDFSRPLPESRYPANVGFVRDIEGWAKLSRRLYVWDYTVDFAHYLAMMANFDALAGNIRFFRANGVTDLFEQGVSARNEGHHAFFAELKAYTLAKLMWNPDLDEEALYDEFIRGFYGKAAPMIREYFDAVRAKERIHRETRGGELTIYQTPADMPFDLEFLAWTDVLHERALEAVKGEDPVFAYNVRMSRLALDYARFHMGYNALDLVSPSDDAAARRETEGSLRRIASALGGERRVAFSQFKDHDDWMHEIAAHPDRLPPRGLRRAGYAEVEDAICAIRSPEEARRVEDPLADDGRAIECFGGKYGWCVTIYHLGSGRFRPGARYRVRVKARVDKVPGIDGNAFWSGIYTQVPKPRDSVKRVVKIAEVKDGGYAWYDLGEWRPEKDDYFWFGAGEFNRTKGEVSSVKAAYIDKLSFEEVAELARNGDFEDGLEGWRNMPPEYAIEAGTGRNGSDALRFGNENPEIYRFPRLPIDLKPGRFYRYGAWIKTELRKKATSGASVCIEWDDDKGKHLGGAYLHGVSGTNGWTKIDGITPRIPANARNFRICPLVPRGFLGTAWFDDVSVTPHPVPPVGELSVSAYRGAVSGGEVRLCAALELNEADFPAPDTLRAEFSWRGSDGAACRKAASVFTRDRAEVAFDSAALPMGETDVTFTLKDSDGKTIGSASAKVARHPDQPCRRVSFDRFNRTLVGGKPFFPLGMYWANPVVKEDVEIYAKGPFNCLMPYRLLDDEMMELCREHGLMTCGVVRRLMSSDPAKRKLAVDYVNRYKEHPSLLAWYTNDEAPLTKLDELVECRRLLMELDPEHPTWTVEDKCSLIRDFMPSFDVIGTDPYPIPRKPLSMTGDWTRQTREATYGMRPIWQVPQTFDWSAYRKMNPGEAHAPTAAEIATMTWLCIAEGANGIFFYSFHDLKKGTRGATFDERWKVVCAAALEVKELMPILLADPAEAPAAPPGVSVRAWTLGGIRHILAVNGTTEQAKFEPHVGAEPVVLDPGEHRFFTADEKQKVQR